jgi:hypothetical protein
VARIGCLDPVTGAHYHMDSRPPPDDEPLKTRLVAPPGAENVESTLPDAFSTQDAEWPALREWFGMFDLVRELDPAGTEESVFQHTIALIDGVLTAKQAKEDAGQHLASLRADRYADWQGEVLVQHFAQMVQLELDRHLQTMLLACDALLVRGCLALPVEAATNASTQAAAVAAGSAAAAAGAAPTTGAALVVTALHRARSGAV